MTTTIRTPFSIDNGRVAVVIDDQNTIVQQKIIDALVTNTLERVGIPEYGGNVTAMLFENTDTLEFQDFKVDLTQAVTSSVTGVSIIDIQWEESYGNPGYINVTVIYRLPLSTATQFTFRLAIPGQVDQETDL